MSLRERCASVRVNSNTQQWLPLVTLRVNSTSGNNGPRAQLPANFCVYFISLLFVLSCSQSSRSVLSPHSSAAPSNIVRRAPSPTKWTTPAATAISVPPVLLRTQLRQQQDVSAKLCLYLISILFVLSCSHGSPFLSLGSNIAPFRCLKQRLPLAAHRLPRSEQQHHRSTRTPSSAPATAVSAPPATAAAVRCRRRWRPRTPPEPHRVQRTGELNTSNRIESNLILFRKHETPI